MKVMSKVLATNCSVKQINTFGVAGKFSLDEKNSTEKKNLHKDCR